jgi:hypothetical protein
MKTQNGPVTAMKMKSPDVNELVPRKAGMQARRRPNETEMMLERNGL